MIVNWLQLNLVSIMPPNPHSTPACPAAVNLEIVEIWILQTGPGTAQYWDIFLIYCIVHSVCFLAASLSMDFFLLLFMAAVNNTESIQ